ncbi:flagellar protein FlgJ [Rhodovulum iodosum]|uniref:Flagellar protein FlgJ n=1 Tax=Rhodovulum iodosum TaxID=68291 RepID=A0ABV3XS42_9RHOB|nr:rod-binding protein [Rhodovulum robiginosum]RSK40011.1 hypothetical protein EJA01_00705 [Rhodovulum robiginosum]
MIQPPPPTTPNQTALRGAARALEAQVIAEMLKAAGLGRTPAAFGGGTGEDQFASFLRQSQAEAMAEAGGFGLAERLFHALHGPADGKR